MRETLLDKAKLLGFKVELDSQDKWIVKGQQQGKACCLEEKESATWLITINQIPKLFLDTKIAINVLNRRLIKPCK